MVSDNQVILSWDIVNSANGYILERKEGTAQFIKIALLGGNSYGDSLLSEGTDYTYRVRSFTNSTTSDGTSNEVMARIIPASSSEGHKGGCGIFFTKDENNRRNGMDDGDYLDMFFLSSALISVYLWRKWALLLLGKRLRDNLKA